MRTHVYTQGGKPILAAFGHYAQLGFAVCAVVWAVLFFALRSREIPLWKAGRVLTVIAVTLGVVLVVLANFMPGFPSLGKLDDLLVFNDVWAPIAARPGASAGRPGRRSLSGVSCWALAPA